MLLEYSSPRPFKEKTKDDKPPMVRLVCPYCGYVNRYRLTRIEREGLPRCCSVDMLIAGEPKLDTTGVSGRVGNIIDPVHNLYDYGTRELRYRGQRRAVR